jgi:hypothetical protein
MSLLLVFSNESSPCNGSPKRSSKLYDVYLLTHASKDKMSIRKTIDRKSSHNKTNSMKFVSEHRSRNGSGDKVKCEDEDLKGIIEEDDQHHGDFGFANKFATSNCKILLLTCYS